MTDYRRWQEERRQHIVNEYERRFRNPVRIDTDDMIVRDARETVIDDLAAMFSCSARTVRRVLARHLR